MVVFYKLFLIKFNLVNSFSQISLLHIAKILLLPSVIYLVIPHSAVSVAKICIILLILTLFREAVVLGTILLCHNVTTSDLIELLKHKLPGFSGRADVRDMEAERSAQRAGDRQRDKPGLGPFPLSNVRKTEHRSHFRTRMDYRRTRRFERSVFGLKRNQGCSFN